MRLCRLWQDAGRRPEAEDVLAPFLQEFTEGADAEELQQARALLRVVSQPAIPARAVGTSHTLGRRVTYSRRIETE